VDSETDLTLDRSEWETLKVVCAENSMRRRRIAANSELHPIFPAGILPKRHLNSILFTLDGCR